MEITIKSNTLISSIIYLLIWISFWGLVECIVVKISGDNFAIQFTIYLGLLVFSYVSYTMILNKKVNIQRYKSNEYPKNEEIISPVYF